MPTYDYACPACSTKREVRQASWSDPAPPCECGELMVKAFSPSVAISTRGHEAVPRGNGGARPHVSRKAYGMSGAAMANIPVVTQDGGLASATGRRLLNPDGTKA